MRNGKIILDTNIWVSYVIGRKLDEIAKIILDSNLTVFFCNELEEELEDVLAREKFLKLLEYAPDVYLAFIRNLTVRIPILCEFNDCPDKKDNFLFDLAIQSHAEFLVTGDKLLLEIKVENLKVISFKQFRQLFSN